MQTLYGVKVTERVTVRENSPGAFTSYFDGVPLPGVAPSGVGAVKRAVAFLQARAGRRQDEINAANRAEKEYQEQEDIAFLSNLSHRLGIDFDDLEKLAAVFARRQS